MQNDVSTDGTAVDQSNDATNASDGDTHDKGRAGTQAGGRNASRASEETKTQDLAKAGRDDFDPNAGQE